MPGLKTSNHNKGKRVSQQEFADIQRLLALEIESRIVAKEVGRSEFFVSKVKRGFIPPYLLGVKTVPWNKGLGCSRRKSA